MFFGQALRFSNTQLLSCPRDAKRCQEHRNEAVQDGPRMSKARCLRACNSCQVPSWPLGLASRTHFGGQHGKSTLYELFKHEVHKASILYHDVLLLMPTCVHQNAPDQALSLLFSSYCRGIFLYLNLMEWMRGIWRFVALTSLLVCHEAGTMTRIATGA